MSTRLTSTGVIVELKVRPEAVEDLKATLKKILPDTRKFPGCRSIHFAVEHGKPGIVVAVETWNSKADHEKYLAWRTETGFIAELGKILEGPPTIRYFDFVDA